VQVDMPEESINWRCPYCGAHQAVLSARFHSTSVRISNDSGEWGPTGTGITTIVCANSDCKKMTLRFALHHRYDRPNDPYDRFDLTKEIESWNLLPESSAKPLPDHIPLPLRNDYLEACRIRDLSPKASATLSRRCLQGMIRDFCGISRNRLVDEIKELEKAVSDGKAPPGVQPDALEAIDHVRKIGNIGAHMEADINVLVDVDPDEAQTLISLLELLFEEWYVARHKRAERLRAIGVVADDKAAAKAKRP
jgi:hypothetical protein